MSYHLCTIVAPWLTHKHRPINIEHGAQTQLLQEPGGSNPLSVLTGATPTYTSVQRALTWSCTGARDVDGRKVAGAVQAVRAHAMKSMTFGNQEV